MSVRFEELAYGETPIGAVSLRRRLDPRLKVEVYEVKIDDEFLMSSLFTVAEIELARLGLAALDRAGGDRAGADRAGGDRAGRDEAGSDPAGWDVVVGGLGLGYTACAVLDDPRVRSMVVVDALAEVVSWHERSLLPFATAVTTDPRSRLVLGDFFAMAAGAEGFDPVAPGRRFDAVLLDVDHSPRHVLHPDNAALYTVGGMRALAAHLRPGGVFALWSNDPPDDDFTAVLAEVFVNVAAHVVTFPNPLQGGESANTVYVAR